MPDKIMGIFDHELGECAKKPEGLPRTFCQLAVFAEKHPRLAGIMANMACSALKAGIKHPKLLKAARRIV